MKKNKSLIILFILLATITQIAAQEKPKVALVLSGGGARGFAHIGVIKALEENHISIDLIVGTSMGAVIGGLYAAGTPIAEIEKEFSSEKWQQLLDDADNRHFKYYRRKKDDELFIVKKIIGFKDGGLTFPYAFFQSQQFYQFLNNQLLTRNRRGDFNQLPIPFRAIATDIETGEPVILAKGDLARSILASAAVPGALAPIEVDGHLLMDGGLSDNLAITIAHKMGASRVIAVDVTSPLLKQDQIQNVKNIAEQVTSLLTAAHVRESKEGLLPGDVMITPDLNNVDFADLDKAQTAILRGKQATLQALSDAAPFPHAAKRKDQPATKISLQKIQIDNGKKLKLQTFYHYLDLPSSPIAVSELSDKMNYLYGLDIFENVFYTLDETDPHLLHVEPLMDRWGPTYLQGSLLATSDFEGDSSYTVSLGLTRMMLNKLMGEWRIIASLGDNNGLFTEIYQPVTPDLTWFIKPSLSVERSPLNIYQDRQRLARMLLNEIDASFTIGRVLGNWGQIQAGIANESGGWRTTTGLPVFPAYHFHHHDGFVSFDFDTLDGTGFAHAGMKGEFEFRDYDALFHGTNHFTQSLNKALLVKSFGDHSFVLSGMFNTTFHGNPGLENKFFLGGPFKLSGFLDDALFGNRAFAADIIYYYRAKQFKWFPQMSIPVYIGGSIESGKVWEQENFFTDKPIYSGSFFVGSDTVIGPIYFMLAAASTGNRAAHLVVNKLF